MSVEAGFFQVLCSKCVSSIIGSYIKSRRQLRKTAIAFVDLCLLLIPRKTTQREVFLSITGDFMR